MENISDFTMALRDLVDAECGGVNSLVHLTSHFVQDQGLKDEGFRSAIPHTDAFSNSDPDQLAQQFLEETSGPSRQTFRMDSLLAEMRDLEGRNNTAPVQSLPVSQLATQDDINCWAEQYLESGKHFQEENQSSIWSPETEPLPDEFSGLGLQDGVSELGFGPNWATDYLNSHEEKQETDTDQAALLNSQDFTQESENTDIMLAANDLLANVDDPRFHYSKFMQFMKLIGEGGVSLETGGVIADNAVADSWSKEYAKQTALHRAEQLWDESEEAANLSDETFTNKLWDKLSQKWGQMSHAGEVEAHPWDSEFLDHSVNFKYNFSHENPKQDLQNALEEGKKKLEAGDLPSAVLCFEAAVQADSDNPLAWQLLGTTQAENEQDPQAIPALKNCVNLDPNNMIALMALAVSFTNENYQNQACQVLKEWLRVNPKYKDLVSAGKDSFKISNLCSLMTTDVHDEVRELYIAAARRNPSMTIDPDVQTGLGVLFNLSSDYDKAVDCFQAALQVRPDDAQLWNRVGATLANGDRSEEAVDAYHNALRLSPGYVRARYNLGITCVHLGANKEAVEHLLTALNQQASGRGVAGETSLTMSDTIWTTLRLVISLLDRNDLVPAINNRDLNSLNREFGIE